MCVGIGDREPTGLEQRPGAPADGLDLAGREKGSQRVGWSVGHPGQVVDEPGGKALSGELPDHRAQLRLGVEAQAVVDGPDPAVLAEDAVPALAIGVVGHDIEGADRSQLVVVGVVLDQGEMVLGEVRGDEELERSRTQWRVVTLDGLRDEVPPEGSDNS